MSRTPLQPVVMAMAVALAGTPGLCAATLATDGEPQMTIVLAEGAAAPERTAAEELAGYLAKVTGAKYPIVGEEKAPAGPCLYVGPTAFARKHGLGPAPWGPERWAMRSVGADLVPLQI